MSEFARYRLCDTLYSSPRSLIHRAEREGKVVVLKRSPASVAVEAQRRIQHEHDMLQLLRGPGVIGVTEIVREGSDVALVLESFGTSLADILRSRRCSLDESLEIAASLARVLARVHAADVVHKDVNPSNVAYDPDTREIRLFDFDLATRHRNQPVLGLEGTLRYMAPEQTGRLERAVDARTDLYSLGASLHELLVGAPPFANDDALALVHAHLATPPQRVDAIDPSIATVVADIVIKLLEKAPERRYQTATGVAKDLERALAQLRASGRIDSFAIGTGDTSTRFEFPDRLFGREAEVQALLEAFVRTTRGRVETVVVAGYSGIGKSSLVREIFGPVTVARGYIGAGKFEQLRGDTPYAAVAMALVDLLHQVLAEGDTAHWRRELADAVGVDGALVVGVVPAFAQILPPTLPLELDPETARRRLAGALARIVGVFSRPDHPLVLFLDDMQWADAASLQLLTAIATTEEARSLLLIEAYRDNEVDPSHPYAHALREHEKLGGRITRIKLAPLDLADATDLVAAALRRAPDEIADIASIIWRKTEGNPFFIRQFLQTLHDDGHLVIDVASGTFAVDAAHLDSAAVTDNVAELLARKLAKLPEAARAILPWAAAIGNRFELAMIAAVTDQSPASIHAALAPALDSGLIVPFGKSARFEHYAFQHDRIQRAAYELVAPDDHARVHAKIGRRLLANHQDNLFEVVRHMNLGLSEIVATDERARLVELELEAARRARRAGASDLAIHCLEHALSLVTWDAYATSMAIHVALAEAFAAAGVAERARATIATALPHATMRDRVTLESLDITCCTQLGSWAAAVACLRSAAAHLGMPLPTDPIAIDAAIGAGIARILATHAGDPVEHWLTRPATTDPDKVAMMELLVNSIPAIYQNEPQLLVLAGVELVTLSLDHGQCPWSSRGYAIFSIVLWAMGEYALGYRFASVGVESAGRWGADQPATEFTRAVFATPYQRPFEEALAALRAVSVSAIEVGDVAHAGYAIVFSTAYRGIRGDRLEELTDDAVRYRKLAARLGLPEIEAWLGWFPWHARQLAGAAPAVDDLDPVAVEQGIIAAGGSKSVLVMWRLLLLEQAFWRGDHTDVMTRARIVEPDLQSLPGNAYTPEFWFYGALSAIAVAPTDPLIARARAGLRGLADACPENFRHMSDLIEAELAAAHGDVEQALRLYDAAADSAAEHGFLKVEILAHERAAAFWLARSKPAFAAIHFAKARDLCDHWGARTKAEELERKRRAAGSFSSDSVGTLRTTFSSRNTLDFATIVKASQAIASEIRLDSLLGKIVGMIVENTGAQTASIVLVGDGAPSVRAARSADGTISVAEVPLAAASCVSEGIVKYVTRTLEPVALADATRHPTFRSDPYVRARRPRSVLCMPIALKDRVLGAIYLENNLVAGAFTVERLEALTIMVAQLAISIENASMFARLEDLVLERTSELREANHKLRVEAVVREQMESELRLAQKLQSVGQLATGIAHELNTPIQYVGNSVDFLRSAFEDLLRLCDVAVSGATPGAVASVADDIDLDFVRCSIPTALASASSGVQRVAKIVRAMKAFSHPDHEGQSATDLHRAIEDTLAVAVSEYRRVADIRLDLAPIPEVTCHAGEVNQVLLNVIVNAAHAIEDVVAGTEQRGAITIATRLVGPDVEIAITDTGCGISEANRDRIFDPFFTTKSVGRGTGQGLSLARTAIVDRHGGKLDFESRLGAGTTFRIRLPIAGAGRSLHSGTTPVAGTQMVSPLDPTSSS